MVNSLFKYWFHTCILMRKANVYAIPDAQTRGMRQTLAPHTNFTDFNLSPGCLHKYYVINYVLAAIIKVFSWIVYLPKSDKLYFELHQIKQLYINFEAFCRQGASFGMLFGFHFEPFGLFLEQFCTLGVTFEAQRPHFFVSNRHFGAKGAPGAPQTDRPVSPSHFEDHFGRHV